MAPNSEEDSQISFSSRRGWEMDLVEKEPLRPPVYNPEDYATSLKKWGKKGCIGMAVPQYLSQSTGSLEKLSEELSLRKKRQSSPSTKSSSSIKSGDEKQSRKEKELTLKTEKKDLKNKENINRGLKSDLQKDFLHPILNLTTHTEEMSLRQFSTVTELLTKLKVDLKLSFPSFVQEFVGDPIDGVTLILELLRCVQLTQSSQQQRCPPQILRRALLDEHSCLVCLKLCLRCPDASRRLALSSAGLFTLAVCIMSNVTQSRIIALELLTKACEPQAGGHKAVSEALSTLRLRFGEPVRFRFLVGMLSSAGAVDLLITAMKFINVFVESAPNLQQKVYIQAELEQAGFNSDVLRKSLPSNAESVKAEIIKWEKNYFDVEKLHNKIVEANVLQEKVHLLEKRIKILQEEKEILQSLEQCLRERCSELEEEVSIKTNTSNKNSPVKPFRNGEIIPHKKVAEKGESTPAEDEGISSSEQELSQDEECVRKAIPYNNHTNDVEKMKMKKVQKGKQCGSETARYTNKVSKHKTSSCDLKNMKNIRSNKMKETNVDDGNEIIPLHGEDDEEDEEEETTIDEVIEELENIVNDAETEAYNSEEKIKILDVRPPPSFAVTSREAALDGICRSFSSQERINFEETEIVPSMLHPQPPKKSKSLVHIYFSGSDLDSHDCNKNEFFDGSDSETSDSLLTTAREEKTMRKNCHKSLEISNSFNSYSSVNTRTLFIKQEQEFEGREKNSRRTYEERNIDEEEIKRKHLKNFQPQAHPRFSEVTFKSRNSQNETQKVQTEEKQTVNKNEQNNAVGKTYRTNASFQVQGNKFSEKLSKETPFSQAPKFAPTPVKRSQTFHITSSDSGNNFQKKIEIKPKPKMGVRGLDFLRSSDQKIKTDNWMYPMLESKKNSDEKRDGNNKSYKYNPKEFQNTVTKNGTLSSDRGSYSGTFSIVKTNRDKNTGESAMVKESFPNFQKAMPTGRSKSVEKMDEGLDSLVDIVISSEKPKKSKLKNEWNAEVSKNIGPRTRRSLAESSLFCSQVAKNLNESEDSQKPPKPAERTSLTRNNSSAIPFHLPLEIKLSPVQQHQHQHQQHEHQQQQPQQESSRNFCLKPAKSADSLLAPSQKNRWPPDGSSSPKNINKNQENPKLEDKSQIYLPPQKANKIHTFFGNPKFNGSDQNASQNYFESNYAAIGSDKAIISPGKNIQNEFPEKAKCQAVNHSPNSPYKKRGTKDKDNQTESKPNFLLGTYQSQSSKILPTKSKMNSSVLQSINLFNNNSSSDKSFTNGNFRKNNADTINSRQSSSNSNSGKVTDTPSGLY